jgi:hypothetical protein
MRAKHVLLAMLALMFISGLAIATETGPAPSSQPALLWGIFSTFLSSFLPYYWYRLDSEARRFFPSRWMSTGIVAMAPVALPIYLLRTRPRGRRLRALLGLLGFCLLLPLVVVVGAVLGFGLR